MLVPMPYPDDGTLQLVSERFRPLLLEVWKALAPLVETEQLGTAYQNQESPSAVLSARRTILRKAIPDFDRQYLAALFPPEEPGLSKLLEEVAETARKLAEASRHQDKA